jgi:hypothetical protein
VVAERVVFPEEDEEKAAARMEAEEGQRENNGLHMAHTTARLLSFLFVKAFK